MKVFPREIIKPARYIGIEPNAVIKDLKDVKVRFALCYPDIYEVGMSYYGLFLLYELINSIEGVWCERCFAPWVDMEDYLKRHNIPLFTLESKTPLNQMDAVGFSLTYELNITNVLNMLKLSRIPIRTSERDNAPIIIGGGAMMLNPLPFEDFFDLIVVGEAEDVIVKIIEGLKETKGMDKWSIIKKLSEFEGVYSPLYGKKKVKRLYIRDLNSAPHALKPPIPIVGSIHNRLNIEVSRGCSNGCRFCLAGFSYRPYRERSFEVIKDIIDFSLKNTGYEEISLLSLSSGDYSYLYETIVYVKNTFKNTSISLPSLKIGSLSEEEIKTIASIARTGFTFALEASKEALRCRLNKDIDIDKFLSQLPVLKRCGWRNIKLYLMVGFPWETEDDLRSIKDVLKEFKKYGISVNLSISPFVPKPHTPFQWLAMDNDKTLKEKIEIIKNSVRNESVKIKYRDINVSKIEAIISRGDRRLISLFEYLSENNIRLEAWNEFFDFGIYKDWFEKNSLDMWEFLKERDFNSTLPWNFIDLGIHNSFFLNELRKAQDCLYTKKCYSQCSLCGLDCNIIPLKKKEENIIIKDASAPLDFLEKTKKITFRYGKSGKAKYIGHLDTMNILLRAFKACGLKIKTHGRFHPMPKIAMSSAIPVGIESTGEFIELEIYNDSKINGDLIKDINLRLPRGIKIYEIYENPLKEIKKDYSFFLVCEGEIEGENLQELFRRDKKVFYSLKTKTIKEFLKYDKIKRIIKIEDRKINAIRAHNKCNLQ